MRLGLAAAVISLTVFHRMTSRAGSRAILTGETFDAARAAEWGLVTEVSDDVDAAVDRVLTDLRKGHPQGLRESKRVVNAELLERIERARRRDGRAVRAPLRLRRRPRGHARLPLQEGLTRRPSPVVERRGAVVELDRTELVETTPHVRLTKLMAPSGR